MSDNYLSTAVAGGDRLEALRAIRDRLARDIDDCNSARDVAALTRQFVDVVDKIAAIQPPTTSKVDELAAKRSNRRAGTGGSETPDTGVPAVGN